ncbi:MULTISPECIES: YaaA family protein [Microbacterium]|uniref:YaaA family protein n=1 Tax=Microbacterium TaxID=33882 RepID=UPI00086EB6D3|nr:MULTISPECIES: peroxide stress protein YaaA [unclassified Microbacterium]MCK9919772.1 peroxide stress protein YaaA [Microbacteriaceae bacterium K1510]ODU76494.1 MAG: hypothetical protein ABT08_09280 [Microbacterium sp. SCN 71-21]
MLVLLPPSETKRPGGRGTFALERLSFPELDLPRREAIAALAALSLDPERAATVLGLSARQRDLVAVNAAMPHAPTLPAIDRYTGVLFDALDAHSLDASARRWLGGHVAIQTAPFGLVGATDHIPDYRLSAGVSLPGIPAQPRHWGAPTTAALVAASRSFVLDLRSEAYAALGPVPSGVPSTYVRVVADSGDGEVRALNHFNKRTKGLLVRLLATGRPPVRSLAGLASWLRAHDVRVDTTDAAEWRVHALH